MSSEINQLHQKDTDQKFSEFQKITLPKSVDDITQQAIESIIFPETFPNFYTDLETWSIQLSENRSMYFRHGVLTYSREPMHVLFAVGTDNAEITGVTEVRYLPQGSNYSALLFHYPWIKQTATKPDYLRKGYNTQRLDHLNQLCHKLWGKPLRSDTVVLPAAQQNWKKLVQQGKAKILTRHNGETVYVFKEHT